MAVAAVQARGERHRGMDRSRSDTRTARRDPPKGLGPRRTAGSHHPHRLRTGALRGTCGRRPRTTPPARGGGLSRRRGPLGAQCGRPVGPLFVCDWRSRSGSPVCALAQRTHPCPVASKRACASRALCFLQGLVDLSWLQTPSAPECAVSAEDNRRRAAALVFGLGVVASYALQRLIDAGGEPPLGTVLRQPTIPYFWRVGTAVVHGLGAGAFVWAALDEAQASRLVEATRWLAPLVVLPAVAAMLCVP